MNPEAAASPSEANDESVRVVCSLGPDCRHFGTPHQHMPSRVLPNGQVAHAVIVEASAP